MRQPGKARPVPLAGRADVLRVLITASFDTRVKRVAGDSRRGTIDPARFVRDNDADRADYFQRFYGIEHERHGRLGGRRGGGHHRRGGAPPRLIDSPCACPRPAIEIETRAGQGAVVDDS